MVVVGVVVNMGWVVVVVVWVARKGLLIHIYNKEKANIWFWIKFTGFPDPQ